MRGRRKDHRATDDGLTIKSHVTDAALIHKRRGQIVAAAVELFSHQGYYVTTIQEVARKAGVSIGLIYQYVQDKEDVLLLALLSVIESYNQEIPAALQGVEDPLLRLHRAVEAYCRVVDARREATVLNYRSTKSLPPARREIIKQAEIETNELIAACLRACVAAGLVRPFDEELTTYQLVSFAHMWALKHWRLRELYTLDAYIARGAAFFRAALLTPKGQAHWDSLGAAAAVSTSPTAKPAKRTRPAR